MKQDVKVAFYLKRNEEKEDGTCPVMARLTVGVTGAVFSAKLTVPAAMWVSGRAKGKSQTAGEINRRLDEIRASALSHWRELSAIREKVTAEDVKTLLLGMAFGQETLLAYFRAHNEKFDKRVGVNRREGTAKSYWNALNHVERFVSEKYHLSDIAFSTLDRSFIDKYDLHLRVDCGLAPGSIVGLTASCIFCCTKRCLLQKMACPQGDGSHSEAVRLVTPITMGNDVETILTGGTVVVPHNGKDIMGEKSISPRRKWNKGGRPPKTDTADFRYSVNFTAQEHARFLTMFEQSGLQSKAAFIKARMFDKPFRVIKTDEGTMRYAAKLTQFHSQFRAVGTNYNQIVKQLHIHF